MLSITRASAKQAPLVFRRGFSEAITVPTPVSKVAKQGVPSPGPSRGRTRVAKRASELPKLSKEKVEVLEDHGLYAFFRRTDANLQGEAAYEVVESPETAQMKTGRAWEAAELRNKSFKDLHTLWYVVLREQNLLATQKEEARRMGVANTALQVSMDKVRNCRKTMARIKAVLNERRLAYEGAIQLAQEQADLALRELERKKSEPQQQQRQQRYDPGDSQILLIQSPPQQPKAKNANRSTPRAEGGQKPQESDPYNSHRTYGNFGKVLQVDEPNKKESSKPRARKTKAKAKAAKHGKRATN